MSHVARNCAGAPYRAVFRGLRAATGNVWRTGCPHWRAGCPHVMIYRRTGCPLWRTGCPPEIAFFFFFTYGNLGDCKTAGLVCSGRWLFRTGPEFRTAGNPGNLRTAGRVDVERRGAALPSARGIDQRRTDSPPLTFWRTDSPHVRGVSPPLTFSFSGNLGDRKTAGLFCSGRWLF